MPNKAWVKSGKNADYPMAAILSERRLAALDRSCLLDGKADPAFDRVVRIAARLLNAPVGVVSLVTPDRQVFRAHHGLDEPWASRGETPLSHSFCQHVVAREEPLVVGDAPNHPLVATNLAVTELGVSAYCGVPLRSPEGEVLGALCTIDADVREWTRDDVERLKDLAEILTAEIATRLRAASLAKLEAEMSERVAEITRLTAEMHHRVGNIFAVILSVTKLSGRAGDLSVPEVLDRVSERVHSLARVHTVNEGAVDYHKVQVGLLFDAFLSPHASGRAITMGGENTCLPYQLVTPIGLVLHELMAEAKRSGALEPGTGHVDLRWLTDNGRLVVRWRAHQAEVDLGKEKRGTEGREDGKRLAEGRNGIFDAASETADACSQIVMQLATQQLEGTLERHELPDGYEWTLRFPIGEQG